MANGNGNGDLFEGTPSFATAEEAGEAGMPREVVSGAAPITRAHSLPAVSVPLQRERPWLTEALVEEAEKQMELEARLKRALVKLTHPDDWIIIDGSPHPEWPAVDKIAARMGISMNGLRIDESMVDLGEGPVITYTASASFRRPGHPRVVEEIGTGSTSDSFFGIRNKEKIPLAQIDIRAVKKKSVTNLIFRGVTRLLGLQFVVDDLVQAFGPERAATIQRRGHSQQDKTSADSPEVSQGRTRLKAMLDEMAGGDPRRAAEICKALTSFQGRDGKQVPGKASVDHLSEPQVKLHSERGIAEAHAKWKAGQGGAGGGADKAPAAQQQTAPTGKESPAKK